MKEIKRAVCLMLCFVMAFGLLPVHANALDLDVSELQPGEFVEEIVAGDALEEPLDPTATFATNTGTGKLVSEKVYTLDTNGGVTANKKYLIVSANKTSGYALTNNNGAADRTAVTIANDKTITVSDDSKIAWVFSGSTSGTVKNNNYYVYLGIGETLSTNERTLTISVHDQKNGAYRIFGNIYGNYYLRYNNGWGRHNREANVYLYELTSESSGEKVTFTVNPGSTTLAPNGETNLTSSVVVTNGNDVDVPIDLSDCTIEWGSSNERIAKVSNGTVTGVANGDATITATLSEVAGTPLEEAITVTISVKVTTRTVTSGKLLGDTHVTTKLNEEPDFSGIKLQVTYDDGSTALISNGLRITGYDITKIGSSYATVSYNGVEYGTIRVTVEGNPYAGLDEATVYPEYPADGAVRIDKTAKELEFASTGLVQVELDVAGISVRSGIDAVLTIDISNSMAWKTGTKDDNFVENKLTEVMKAVNTFADILLAPDENGNPTTDNTITIVFFAGKDAEHWAGGTNVQVDAVLTACSKVNDIKVIQEITSKTKFTGKDGNEYLIQIAHVNNAGKVVTYAGQNRGDTNYDYAFWQTEQAVDQIITANGADSTREIHVLLMTDGCATHFNNVYYNSGSTSNYYRPGTRTTYGSDGNFKNLGSTAWVQWIENSIIKNDGNLYARSLYEKVDGGYAVGFDMAHGSFSGISSWDSSVHWDMVFNEIVQRTVLDDKGNGMINVTNATDTEILGKFYRDLATKLRYAGTSANVADEIDPDFTLQMSSFTGTVGQGIGQVNIAEKGYKPSITIKTYDLYSKTETNDPALIGTRKGTSQDIETVTFNADGTVATSDKKDGNILRTEADGTVVIEALYFTYTKTPEGVETFKWNIGNITDKEIALSYFAYLKGSLEGKEPDGLKYTNEGATLDYIDINGDHAQQIFPIPAVAWGGASTSYEFYLVNDDGKPCDREGNEIPFANRIIITGPYFQELYLNQSDEEIAQEIIAVKVLPAGYTLYDETAKYEVQTASGDNDGYLKINDPGYGLITSDDPYNGPRYDKVTNDDGTVSYVVSENGAYKKLDVQTTIRVFPEAGSKDTSFIQSRVAFGVIYNMIPSESTFVIAPDAVVIDYGKEILIDVNSNNDKIPSDVTATLIGFSKFYDDIDVKQQFSNTPYSTPFEGTYGTFSITADNKVSYVPHKLVNNVGKIFCVYRMTKGSDTYYMVSELDVIPATVMYYETDFATGVFTTTDWTTQSEGAAADGPQDDGTIGQNTYGYDDSYTNDALLSNGSSLYAEGAGVNVTTATFSFTGTGFDLISRTGAEQGLIKVQVFTDAKMTNVAKTVAVLNKSESNLELYQIPVVSINGLEHGTYYVKIGVDVGYSNTNFAALYRGNQFYFDAIRIYDPAKGNAIAEAAYNADGEANNELDEVRQMLISANTFEAIASGSTTAGMVYVDSTYTNGEASGNPGNVNVTDYAKVGPNNEVYLSNGQAVAFKVNANSIPASFDIGAKSITGSTAGLKVTVRNEDGSKSWTVTKDIASSTVQFIDLLAATGVDASQIYKGAYVVITNTRDGVLSITDLKTAFSVGVASVEVDAITGVSTMSNGKMVTPDAVKPVEPFCVSYTVDAYTLDVARMVLTGDEEPEVPEVPETPETPEKPETPDVDTSFYKIQNVMLKINGSAKNQKCTFTVVTSQKVEDIEIVQNGAELMPARTSFKDKKSGERVWTIELRIGTYDKNGIFTLTGIGESGVRGESVIVNNMKNR